ncbi:RecX family transcriptional regulator [Paenibacillus sp. y28]|uniref:RecX family transcriptional regulator n=1 Tax=Paenibacillus sp. y28 TaxID=3129110 RepID=UPI0030177300
MTQQEDDRDQDKKFREQPGTTGSYVITRVERLHKPKGKYLLSLDGEPVLEVDEEVCIQFRLMQGTVLDQEQLRAIRREDTLQTAYKEAIRYIGRRPRSAAEVYQQLLRKQVEPEAAEEIVERLRGRQYINDADFAVQWTQHRIYSQKKGRLWIRQELKQKGVSGQHIHAALEEVDEEREMEIAFELAVKKWRVMKDEARVRRQKVGAFLMRKGFPSQIVSRVLRKVVSEYPVEGEADGETSFFEE